MSNIKNLLARFGVKVRPYDASLGQIPSTQRRLDDHARTLRARLGWDESACSQCGGSGRVVETFVEQGSPDEIQSRTRACPSQCPEK